MEKPEPARASSGAEGPGTISTGTPASMAARINRSPGSLTPGMPASETSAIDCPCSNFCKNSAVRFASLNW